MDAATKRGVPWFRIGEDSFVQLGYGRNRRFIQAAMCDQTSAVAVEAAGDKEFTKVLLRQVSIPVPRGKVVRTEEDAVDALGRIGVPVVVKALDGRQGLGVSLYISTPEQMKQAFAVAREYSERVLVEELFVGKNYRVLVVGGKMVAASERFPAHVVGDGRQTISELIEVANRRVGALLEGFDSNFNPGPANLYQVDGGYVMVDYGHNPDAFAAVCRLAAEWNDRRVTGIIGVPGDRDESVIEQAGRIAARGFHRVIIKEDVDLRGREKGEVARLLCQAVSDESSDTECHVVLDEITALRSEIEAMQDGQVIVVFYDTLGPVMKLLERVGALPVSAIGEVKLTGVGQKVKAYSATGA